MYAQPCRITHLGGTLGAQDWAVPWTVPTSDTHGDDHHGLALPSGCPLLTPRCTSVPPDARTTRGRAGT